MGEKRTLIVGVAGGSASGKSTFTRQLLASFEGSDIRVELVNIDKYFYRGKDGGPTIVFSLTGETMADNNHPNSADNARLIADIEARCSADDAPDILIIEGHIALAVEELRNRFDIRLFLDLEPDVRAIRRLMRDMSGGRGDTDPSFIVNYYLECARVGHIKYIEPSKLHADMVLRGDSDFNRTVPMVAALLRGSLLAPKTS